MATETVLVTSSLALPVTS